MIEPLRALIVDDEPPARQVLLRLLRDSPDVVIAGTAANGWGALGALAQGDIDVLFLDIEMPMLAGMELAARLYPAPTPAVIFVTAWPQYAVDAFDIAAADYLLKPVDPARLAAAIARARQRLARPRLEASLRVLRARKPVQDPSDYVWVEHGTTHLRLSLGDIEWFAADGDYVCAHTAERGFLMRDSLNHLEAGLSPSHFLRVHRSTLVNVEAVVRVAMSNGHLLLTTRSGATLKVGRRARSRVRKRLADDSSMS